MITIPDDNEIISRLSIAGSTPDSVANLLRGAGYNGMTGRAIRQRLMKLEKKTPLRKSAVLASDPHAGRQSPNNHQKYETTNSATNQRQSWGVLCAYRRAKRNPTGHTSISI